MGRVVFITGGARSGKSAYALRRAQEYPAPRVYIATAQALDPEMEERIRLHRLERGEGWETMEAPLDLAGALAQHRETPVVLIDCLTLWVSNLLMSGKEDPGPDFDALVREMEIRGPGDGRLFIVSNEVGMGIVPENALARRFRDLAGRLNQAVAGAADEAYLVVAGLPVRIR